ncbi:histone-lysine N-methyltransferase SUV39H2 [Aphelenchoides avenae]|nr:histone-lysine N-methyltransferase SUV39H2 [Aphelenchus avenae]
MALKLRALKGAESDSSQEYEVEEIVEKRVYVQYLLKWKGYSAVYNSWEDAANLTRCEELLEDFNAPHPPDNTDEPALSSSQHVADDLPDL